MKFIWLGIKDYCRDCWHDFWFKFWNALWTFTQRRTCKCYVWRNSEGLLVKEGSVWHYIRQRKIRQHIIQKGQKRGEIDNMLSNKKLWGDKTEEEIGRDVCAMVNGLTNTKKTKYVRKRGKKCQS